MNKKLIDCKPYRIGSKKINSLFASSANNQLLNKHKYIKTVCKIKVPLIKNKEEFLVKHIILNKQRDKIGIVNSSILFLTVASPIILCVYLGLNK